MTPELQAAIAELETQRNMLGTRALRLAVEKAKLEGEVAELTETVAVLRADILARDNVKPEA